MLDSTLVAAYTFGVLIAIVVLFQLALALGAPWGEMAMGGKFPGRFPTAMRVAALFQIVILVFIALIVLARAGIFLEAFSAFAESAIWGVVIYSLLGTILNIMTPSKKERILWVPVTMGLLICSAIVAVSQ